MPNHTEITRFTSSGKTFFFNEGEARNGNKFLIINALHGQHTRQGITLLSGQYMEFANHLNDAIEGLTGFVRSSPSSQPTQLKLPVQCPKCDGGSAGWDLSVVTSAWWNVRCECGEMIYQSEECKNG